MKLLTTERDIRVGIFSMSKNAKSVAGEQHALACSILRLWHLDGNVARAVRLANDLLEGMHNSSRKNAMKDWFIGFAGFVWADKSFVYHKDRTTISKEDAQKAIKEPFWVFSPEKPYVPLNLDTLIENAIKKAEARRKKGLTNEDVVPEVKVRALKMVHDATPEQLAAILSMMNVDSRQVDTVAH